MFEVKGKKVYGRYFRQDYDLPGGKAAGQYSNGNIAAVENTFGQGRTLLMGIISRARDIICIMVRRPGSCLRAF